jgi:hypothetical protein
MPWDPHPQNPGITDIALSSHLNAEEKQWHHNTEIEALARTCKERERQKAALVSGSADTCWTGASNAHNMSTLA